MVQRWASSHDLPRSNRTLGPQVPVLTTVTPSPPQSSAAASLTATDMCSPNLEDIPEDNDPEEESTSPIITDEDPETLNVPGTLQDP